MTEGIPESSRKLFEYVRDKINRDDELREAESRSYLLLEHIFSLERNDIILDRSISISGEQEKQLIAAIERINRNEPIQYILGEAEFYGRKFMVNSNVLIPRSETEELIELILRENKDRRFRLFDVGTGTACIPVTIAKEHPQAKCFALDFNPRALKLARQNAERYNVAIEFYLIDILKESFPVNHLDIVVSNPPYITQSEKKLMQSNVLDYEPHSALFIPGDEPLLFYDRISGIAYNHLKPGGRIYFEINEEYGGEVVKCLEENGFTALEVVKDIHGKDRFVRGDKPL